MVRASYGRNWEGKAASTSYFELPLLDNGEEVPLEGVSTPSAMASEDQAEWARGRDPMPLLPHHWRNWDHTPFQSLVPHFSLRGPSPPLLSDWWH